MRFAKKIPVLNKLLKKVNSYLTETKEANRIKQSIRKHPIRIVIGASGIFEGGWTPTEIQNLNLLVPQHWNKLFKKSSIDAILAEHVWEHLTLEDGIRAAKQCYEYLKPGGYLRVAVPDGFHPDPQYLEWVKVGGTGPGATDHKVLYNHKLITESFTKAGFTVELLEYFDSDGQFHFKDWDPLGGKIHRSKRFDKRNADGQLQYTSLIVDAHKDA